MSFHDPNPTAEFPDRPDHEDYRRLSYTAQGMDLRAATASIPEIIGLDAASVDYFIQGRLNNMSQLVGIDLTTPLFMALYMDGLTVGTLAEKARRE